MKFKFHLFVQKHQNRTYTVTVIPFYDLTAFGVNLDDVKNELAEAVKERVRSTLPQHLHHFEFDPRLTLQKVQVDLRPVDRKNQKKRREQMRLGFSLLVRPEEDGQLYVTVPRLGNPPLAFYVFNQQELHQQAQIELAAWFEGSTIDHLLEHRSARSESLDSLEIDIPLKKPKEQDSAADAAPADSFWALREVGVNLTAQVNEGRFRRTYRRDHQVDEVFQTLCSPRNNSLVLVGPSEAGKTAIIHEVVRRIQRKECPEALYDRQVWMLTPDRLIAGAQFIGTWEERIQDIANECRQKQHILFVEDLPGLLEVGRWSKSDSNIGMALKPHIASGEVIILGESSPERMSMGMGLGASFMNLFRTMNVEPMAEDESLAVLGNVARDLEREFDLRVDPNALEASIELSRRFLPYRSFPGKAIRLLEETTADANKTRPPAPENPFSLLRRVSRLTVDRRHIINMFSRQSGMPEFVISDETRLDISDVERYFHERIIGQDQAVSSMVSLVAMVKSGLNDPKKPLGTFLFIGPTGVGKTEMAKTLASYLFGDPARLIRFDMSEYGNLDGVSRLIGAFNSEGELTRRVREQPFCVVLLDEFEKADSRIYDIFLQVLGEGRLTDARGRTTSFHNAIVIMTSNLGSGQRQMRSVGFGYASSDPVVEAEKSGQVMDSHYRQHVEGYFRPEFVNRIDQIVTFRALAPESLRKIATRELTEILRRDGITRRALLVEIDNSVIDLVLEHGYSPVYGARPLKREIERLVVAPLARTLAERSSRDQHLFRIQSDQGQLVIKAVPIEDAEKTEVVTLSSAMGGAVGLTQHKMDMNALVDGLAVLRRKLADWDASDMIKEMRTEKTQLLNETQRVDFWRNADEARDTMTRFYFLDRLLQRLSQLLERAEYLEDFGVMINRERALGYQGDLARDYEDLFHKVSYLDIELMTAHLPHRNQAVLLLAPLGNASGTPGADSDSWARRLAEMYLNWAERKGYEFDVFTLQPQIGAPGDMDFLRLSAGNFADLMERFSSGPHTTEIAIAIQGSNVFGFLKGERGLHKLAGRDSASDELTQVRVFAIPDNTRISDWLHDYQIAKVEIAEGKRAEPQKEKLTIIRNYSLERTEKYVRDLRTGVRLSNVKEVMGKGLLDELILAFLQTEESNVTWEDRFPPTFPF